VTPFGEVGVDERPLFLGQIVSHLLEEKRCVVAAEPLTRREIAAGRPGHAVDDQGECIDGELRGQALVVDLGRDLLGPVRRLPFGKFHVVEDEKVAVLVRRC
jgi:hypothetical protein